MMGRAINRNFASAEGSRGESEIKPAAGPGGVSGAIGLGGIIRL